MELDTLGTLVEAFMAELPEQVANALSDVDMVLAASPADATKTLLAEARDDAKEKGETLSRDEIAELTIREDAKGCFIGDPRELTSDADPGEEEPEVKYDAEGYIVMCASNIADKSEAMLVFLHEVGHALGLDEDEVKELGLAATTPKEGNPDAISAEHATNG